jgi:hypothetical protein
MSKRLIFGLTAAAALTFAPLAANADPVPPEVPAVCVAVPTSTGGSTSNVGYCPPGTTPTPLPVALPGSVCVPLPVETLGRPGQVGYCPN